MIEGQLDRTTFEAGIDMAPTKKMIDFALDLSQKYEVDLPEVTKTDFIA